MGKSFSEPLRLFLVRHGETAWSMTGQHTGLTDIPLTAHGEQEARALGVSLRTTAFTTVLTSPLRRARQICELAALGVVTQVEPDLTEWHYGDYEGERTCDIQRIRAGWHVWRDGWPQGESPADVTVCADRLLGRLQGLYGNVALFTHGQFGAALGARWIKLAVGAAEHLPLGPGCLSILAYDTGSCHGAGHCALEYR